MKRGLVRTTKLTRVYEPETHYKYNSYTGYTNIHVCSSNALPEHKDLSPMILGPIITGDHDFPECKNLENFWNWSKVYRQEVISPPPTNKNITKFFKVPDFDDSPDDEYLENRKKWFTTTKADLDRMRKGKNNRHNFMYCWYDGQKIYDYIECRKTFYCSVYAQYVQDTASFKLLKERLDRGEYLGLTGWDAIEWCEEKDPDLRQMKQVINDKDKTFGHELVLACMLTENRIW